ncbi:hypothetical protein Pelo_17470 [Pelomyxa schiedti]|nr:hypothetical protein Pelo_17470 [Pelomyxa schiedti]
MLMEEFHHLEVRLSSSLVHELSSVFVSCCKIQHGLVGVKVMPGTSTSSYYIISTLCKTLVKRRVALDNELIGWSKTGVYLQDKHKDFLTDVAQINVVLRSIMAAFPTLERKIQNLENLEQSGQDLTTVAGAQRRQILKVSELYGNLQKDGLVPEQCVQHYGELCKSWELCQTYLEKYLNSIKLQQHQEKEEQLWKFLQDARVNFPRSAEIVDVQGTEMLHELYQLQRELSMMPEQPTEVALNNVEWCDFNLRALLFDIKKAASMTRPQNSPDLRRTYAKPIDIASPTAAANTHTEPPVAEQAHPRRKTEPAKPTPLTRKNACTLLQQVPQPQQTHTAIHTQTRNPRTATPNSSHPSAHKNNTQKYKVTTNKQIR